jgi:hypothetical protein
MATTLAWTVGKPLAVSSASYGQSRQCWPCRLNPLGGMTAHLAGRGGGVLNVGTTAGARGGGVLISQWVVHCQSGYAMALMMIVMRDSESSA